MVCQREERNDIFFLIFFKVKILLIFFFFLSEDTEEEKKDDFFDIQKREKNIFSKLFFYFEFFPSKILFLRNERNTFILFLQKWRNQRR